MRRAKAMAAMDARNERKERYHRHTKLTVAPPHTQHFHPVKNTITMTARRRRIVSSDTLWVQGKIMGRMRDALVNQC
jgi:hypothetical protein